MLSKNKIKFIQSLSRKKERDDTRLFIAEGHKIIFEFFKAGFQLHTLISPDDQVHFKTDYSYEHIICSDDDIRKISLLKSASKVFAIFYQPEYFLSEPDGSVLPALVLDQIQDPGNLGTIIRLASWFGIKNIICSHDTVECFNPKVVQATIGALAYVNCYYTSLIDYLSPLKNKGITIYGTFLQGENIYSDKLDTHSIVIFGNEGNGIRKEIEDLVTHKIVIPSISNEQSNVDSLNVSIAAAIFCSELRRDLLLHRT